MTHNTYTQFIVIKNPNEQLKSQEIKISDGKILSLGRSDSEPVNAENGVITVKTPNRNPGKKTGNYLYIIAPGFINLHAHLAYTDLELEAQDLFPWMIKLVLSTYENFSGPQGKINLDPRKVKLDILNASIHGANEAISYGTTFLVDNSNFIHISIESFVATGLKGIVGVELFGSDNAEEIFKNALKLLREFSEQNLVRLCLSPHAAYDVSAKLWKLAWDWTCEHRAGSARSLLLSHIAESPEEENFFQGKNCPDAEKFWDLIGSKPRKLLDRKYESSIQYLLENNLLMRKRNSPQAGSKTAMALLAHAVQASRKDLATLKDFNVALVACPRSNIYLNNGKPDIALWEDLGLLYGVGTDSKASNQDLDLRVEVNKLAEIYEESTGKKFSARRKLELLTTNAAQILGSEEIGSLEEGKSADFTIFQIEATQVNEENILELLFDTDICKVHSVYINGKKSYESCNI